MLEWPRGDMRSFHQHLRFWFGTHKIAIARLREIKTGLHAAMERADALGFYQGNARNHHWRYPAHYITLHVDVSNKRLAGNDLHRQLWQSGNLDTIVTSAKHTVLITCRDVARLFTARYATSVEILHVPGEGALPGQGVHVDRFNYYRAMIHTIALPGVLFLVGAGVLGKVYCDSARQAGAVAVDIGSVFDGWAGLKTRSYFAQDGMQSYKLDT